MLVLLDLPSGFPSGLFETLLETSDSGEQASYSEFHMSGSNDRCSAPEASRHAAASSVSVSWCDIARSTFRNRFWHLLIGSPISSLISLKVNG